MQVELGKVGSLSFSGGKAVLSATLAEVNGAVTGMASISMDAGLLIDVLEQIVAKEFPATAAINPAVFGAIKKALASIA